MGNAIKGGGEESRGELNGMECSCQFLSEPRTLKGRRGKETGREQGGRKKRRKKNCPGPDYQYGFSRFLHDLRDMEVFVSDSGNGDDWERLSRNFTGFGGKRLKASSA